MGTDCVKVDAYSDASVFDSLEAEWTDLLAKSTPRSFFLTPQWQRLWWDHFSDDRRIRIFAVRSGDDEMLGLCTLSYVDGRAEFLGGRDLCDHLDVLSLPGHEETVASGVLMEVREHIQELQELHLNFVPEDSRMIQPLQAVSKDLGWEISMEAEETSPYIPLPESWDEYLTSLRGKDRHELRRKMRRAEAHAPLTIRKSTKDTLEKDIETFIELHAMSTREKSDFMDQAMKEFFRRVAFTAMAEGWLQLSFLEFDGAPAAGLLCFDYDQTLLIYNSGYDASLSSANPGIALFGYTIRDAIEDGRRTVDFLRGNETYKFRLGGQDRLLYHVKLCPKP